MNRENKDKNLVFSGKLGEMSLQVHEDVDIKQEDNSISFAPNKETKESLAITGTMRALATNMIQGVEVGFDGWCPKQLIYFIIHHM